MNAPEHASNALSATPGNRMKQKRYSRRHQLLKLYGITIEQYYELLKKQDWLCGICGRPPKQKKGPGSKLHVDHDHRTGKVRGLLCVRCNGALSIVEDARFVAAAHHYLRTYGSRF